MILDNLALFATAQESTLSVASTDIVDTIAKGDSYEGAWFVARIDTAVTGGSSASTTFQLQTADTENFSGTSAATLIQSAAYLPAALTVGKFFAARIPPGAKRYLRAYKVVGGSGVLTAGKYNYFIAKDIDLSITHKEKYLLP